MAKRQVFVQGDQLAEGLPWACRTSLLVRTNQVFLHKVDVQSKTVGVGRNFIRFLLHAPQEK